MWEETAMKRRSRPYKNAIEICFCGKVEPLSIVFNLKYGSQLFMDGRGYEYHVTILRLPKR